MSQRNLSQSPTQSPQDWSESTRTHIEESQRAGKPKAPAASDRAYLVVFDASSSSMFPLPRNGQIVIGRAETCDLSLRDNKVSRKHAEIELAEGEARILDLESQNGTLVNGQRLVGGRPLVSGDIISISTMTLVFHSNSRHPSNRRLLEPEEFRQRVDEELERSLRYNRPLTLLAVGFSGGDRPRVAQALCANMRLIDVLGWGGPEEVLVLVPELGPDTAAASARRLLQLLADVVSEARVGLASFPGDGCEADTLLASARAAYQAARAGNIASAASAFRSFEIGSQKIVVADPAMNRLFALIEKLATSDLPVLVCGETGTGKELAASALHAWSARRTKTLVTLNCAAIHENLLESELFGYEKGAFSGAMSAKPGLLETAEGGTVFLDEIGELPATAQAKLLRVLETKRVTRLGDVREREINIRIVAATNRNLETEVKDNRFRKDLFFRLSGAQLWLPPLRDRKRELPLLAQALLGEACERAEREPMAISDSAMQTLARYPWPGNVRELKNVMDYVAAAISDPVLAPWHLAERLGGPSFEAPPPGASSNGEAPVEDASRDEEPTGAFRALDEELRDLERRRIVEALGHSGGNQTRAAKLLHMPLRTFVTKLKQYQITPATDRMRTRS